ncbi:MAG: AI-2E family transporter [Alphaproteobacteria bacterium]|jgi:predicted PurR-regulated permease PerM
MHKRWWFWIAIALLFFVFLFLIRSVLLPFVLGIMVAYFLDPAADKLQRKGMSRGIATTVLTAMFFVSITLLALIIVPVIANQFSGLVAALPDYIVAFEQSYGEQIKARLGGLGTEQMEHLKSAINNISGTAIKLGGDLVANLFLSGMALINMLSLVLITPIVAFYILRDWDGIVERVDNLLPRKHAHTIREQMQIIDATLAGFIRGQINVCLILGTYYAIGLSLAGLKFGIVIGLATGFLVIFPYVGLMLGMSVGLGVAFFQFGDMASVLTVLAVFVTGQMIEGYFITPKLVGEKVGLHPVWIIFGMLAGAALFGFVGILLAIPVTAVIGVLIRFATKQYQASSYYNDTPSKPTKA